MNLAKFVTKSSLPVKITSAMMNFLNVAGQCHHGHLGNGRNKGNPHAETYLSSAPIMVTPSLSVNARFQKKDSAKNVIPLSVLGVIQLMTL